MREGEGWYFSHGGSNWGFECYMTAHRLNGYGAVVMTNGDAGGALAQEIMREIPSACWRICAPAGCGQKMPHGPRLVSYSTFDRDPRTGEWVRARYRAERHEIAARYAEWQITGPSEIRDADPDARYFTPHTSPLDAVVRSYSERAPSWSLQSTHGRPSCSRCSYADTLPTARDAEDLRP